MEDQETKQKPIAKQWNYDYDNWCRSNNCTHGHCPYKCDHPQPFLVDGRFVCGACAFLHNELVDMEPCTIKIC